LSPPPRPRTYNQSPPYTVVYVMYSQNFKLFYLVLSSSTSQRNIETLAGRVGANMVVTAIIGNLRIEAVENGRPASLHRVPQVRVRRPRFAVVLPEIAFFVDPVFLRCLEARGYNKVLPIGERRRTSIMESRCAYL
jgi:hypothetical protein